MSESENGGQTPERNPRPVTVSAVESLAAGIEHLESFLDDLTRTLLVQNQQVQAMNREREEYLTRISAPTPTTNQNTPPSQPPRPGRGLESAHRNHPALQHLARHTPPPGMTPYFPPGLFDHLRRPAGAREMATPARNSRQPQAPPTEIGEDVRQLLDRMRTFAENQETYQPGVQLDQETQFGSTPSTSTGTNGGNRGETNPGGGDEGDTLLVTESGRIPFQNAPLLIQVIKRAAEAAAVAGDFAGHAQLEQFQQELTSTLRRGVGIMQNLAEMGATGTGELTLAITPSTSSLNLGSSSSSSTESDSGGDESTDFELQDWDRGTSRNMLNEYFRAEGDEIEDSDEEGRLVFFGVFNQAGGDDEEVTGRGEEETEGRRQANRNLSPNTVEFYQSIGIRIDDEDVAKMANGFTDAVVFPCPQTLYPEGEPMGSDTPTPLIYIGASEAGGGQDLTLDPQALFDFLAAQDDEDEEEEDVTERPPEMKLKDHSTQTLQEIPGTSPSSMELDAEDLELEKLIHDFKRKKMESKGRVAKMEKEDEGVNEAGASVTQSTSKGGGKRGQERSSGHVKVDKGISPGGPSVGRKEKKTPPKSAPGGGRQGQSSGSTGTAQKPGSGEEVKVRRVQMTTCLGGTPSTIKNKGTKKDEK